MCLCEAESKPNWAKQSGRGSAIAAWQATAALQQTGSTVGGCWVLIPTLQLSCGTPLSHSIMKSFAKASIIVSPPSRAPAERDDTLPLAEGSNTLAHMPACLHRLLCHQPKTVKTKGCCFFFVLFSCLTCFPPKEQASFKKQVFHKRSSEVLSYQCKAVSPVVAGPCIKVCMWVWAWRAVQAKILVSLQVQDPDPASKTLGGSSKMKDIAYFCNL